jgi:hypothetical protein
VLLRYSSAGTGYLVFKKGDTLPAQRATIPLASGWFANRSVLPYDFTPGNPDQAGWFRFKAPPGLESIELAMNQKPQVWVNGREVPVKKNHPLAGLLSDSTENSWKADLPSPISASSTVAVRVGSEAGSYGGAVCLEPIRLNCGKGVIRLGNLFDNESLMTYSGGMWYRKSIVLIQGQAESLKITLDLGELVSAAEVYINGKPVGKRLSPPWDFDLTGKVKSGDNQLEVLIYNTLGNYYLTTPSKYIGDTKSGLIGPARLLLE